MFQRMNKLLESLRRELEETEHERCANGTHWNDNEKKCMKVDGATRKAVSGANLASSKAAKSEDANWGKRHDKIAMAHGDAKKAHQHAADTAAKAGFNELAGHHAQKAKHHDSEADKHWEKD